LHCSQIEDRYLPVVRVEMALGHAHLLQLVAIVLDLGDRFLLRTTGAATRRNYLHAWVIKRTASEKSDNDDVNLYL
jgi:hypothetical protein